jgi:DedD protein
MSVRYTADATMDEPALRDVERWKDKIEVRLDNRQVFFLFFGSALVACMLFVLGVIVGKRIESRGRADAPEISDPLAVLDRVNQTPLPAAVPPPAEQNLAFPKALIGNSGLRAKPMGLQPRPAAAPVAVPASAPPAPAPRAVEAPPVKAAAPPAPAAPKPIAAAAKPPAPVPAKPAASGPVVVKAPPPVKAPVAGEGALQPPPKGKFTLQLSSFPDRLEADIFAKKYAAQGAFIVTSEIPGKGTWYRVRMGNFASAAEATAAKANFEKQHNVIAYVAAR